VTRVVGEHDQETVDEKVAVPQISGPGLGVRDTDGGHERPLPDDGNGAC
jgi:hypothetical protein